MGDGGDGELCDILFFGIDTANFIGAQPFGPQFAYLLAEPGNVTGPPRVVGQVLRIVKVHRLPMDAHLFQAELVLYACPPLQAHLQGIRYAFKVPHMGRILGAGKDAYAKKKRDDIVFHERFFCFRMSRKMTRRVLSTRAVPSATRSSGSPLR